MRLSGSGFIEPVICYGYDDNGNLTSVSRKAFDDIAPVLRLSRGYDALNGLIRFTDASKQHIQYGYDANGNLTTLVYPDGSEVEYSYDAANRLTTVTDWAGRPLPRRFRSTAASTAPTSRAT